MKQEKRKKLNVGPSDLLKPPTTAPPSLKKYSVKQPPHTQAFSAPYARPNTAWFPVLLVLFGLLLATGTVRAHGGQGYYQIRGEQMGDYTIHVWTAPGLLRTGEVHVDTAVFDADGFPAFHTVILVRFIPIEDAEEGEAPGTHMAMAGSPYDYYPYTREARFEIDTPGEYRMEIMISDPDGMVGMAEVDVEVQTIPTSTKLVIGALGMLSLACGVWLLIHAQSFWRMPGKRLDRGGRKRFGKSAKSGRASLHAVKRLDPGDLPQEIDPVTGLELTRVGPVSRLLIERELQRSPHDEADKADKPDASLGAMSPWAKAEMDAHAGADSTDRQQLERFPLGNRFHRATGKLNLRGGIKDKMANVHTPVAQAHAAEDEASRWDRWYLWLNGPYHARALWIFMLIVVAHWLEHVLQIYQIYGLGWAPSESGGLIGVFFPVLITSETLHFVYDFIQWAGIVVLRGGFVGRARKFWLVAMVIQTWHFIEHVLLMGQYLTGYYIAGRVKQTSILELMFPREELHFVYNLLVFVPMVIAVHYYLRLDAEIDPEGDAPIDPAIDPEMDSEGSEETDSGDIVAKPA